MRGLLRNRLIIVTISIHVLCRRVYLLYTVCICPISGRRFESREFVLLEAFSSSSYARIEFALKNSSVAQRASKWTDVCDLYFNPSAKKWLWILFTRFISLASHWKKRRRRYIQLSLYSGKKKSHPWSRKEAAKRGLLKDISLSQSL